MATGAVLDIPALLASFNDHNWQTRQFSVCADEVFQGWGEENILYAVEHCNAWRADYEMESYEYSGSLFIIHTIKDVGVVVDYYTLNEEVYERVYQNLVPQALPKRVLMKLKKALGA